VAVERETHSIRLKVGNNDGLTKVNPKYLGKHVFLTDVLRDVLVYGQ